MSQLIGWACLGVRRFLEPAMSESSSTHVIDARELPPPEPMARTLTALDDLAPGGEIVLLVTREPTPLYGVLARNGCSHRTEFQADGSVAVHIRLAV